jgi:hypothetical protein
VDLIVGDEPLANLHVGGIAVGIPVVQAPPIPALASACAAAGAATKGTEMPQTTTLRIRRSIASSCPVTAAKTAMDEQDKKRHKCKNEQNPRPKRLGLSRRIWGLTNRRLAA